MPPIALIVDRDEDTRAMYAEHLKLNAYMSEQASDGREALAKAIAYRPDVVVTETRLAGIDGYELCQLLRKDADTSGTPIIVVTGDAVMSDLEHARKAGADSVLTKPCLPETLLAEIQRLLARPVPRSAESTGTVRPQAAKARLSRGHRRYDTKQPAQPPPDLMCPECLCPLLYERSHIGGVSERHRERWDDFRCQRGCGDFQYRHRTRRLSKKVF